MYGHWSLVTFYRQCLDSEQCDFVRTLFDLSVSVKTVAEIIRIHIRSRKEKVNYAQRIRVFSLHFMWLHKSCEKKKKKKQFHTQTTGQMGSDHTLYIFFSLHVCYTLRNCFFFFCISFSFNFSSLISWVYNNIVRSVPSVNVYNVNVIFVSHDIDDIWDKQTQILQ